MEFRLEAIYVKPYVKAYYNQVGLNDDEKKYLYGLLCHPIDTRKDIDLSPPRGCVAWRPEIPERWYKENRYCLTISQARDFANLLEYRIKLYFETAFLAEVRTCRRNEVKFEINKLILDVRDGMGLDENSLPLDTITKYLQRFSFRKNIFYQDIKKHKKLSSKVSKKKALKAARADKLPEGYMYLREWLKLAGITGRTFRRCYRDEFPTMRIGRELAIATINASV